jgi:hypothetical protein
VDEKHREWVRRHHIPIGIGLALVFMFFGVVLFPHSPSEVAAVIAVLIGVFITWVRFPLARLKLSAAGTPSISIRDRLRRTNALFQRVMVPVLIAWVVGVTLFATDIPKSQRQPLLYGGALLIALIGGLYIRGKLRCPQCGTDFRKERIAKLGRWSFDTRMTTDLWDACPRCGVSFDEPYHRVCDIR